MYWPGVWEGERLLHLNSQHSVQEVQPICNHPFRCLGLLQPSCPILL